MLGRFELDERGHSPKNLGRDLIQIDNDRIDHITPVILAPELDLPDMALEAELGQRVDGNGPRVTLRQSHNVQFLEVRRARLQIIERSQNKDRLTDRDVVALVGARASMAWAGAATVVVGAVMFRLGRAGADRPPTATGPAA